LLVFETIHKPIEIKAALKNDEWVPFSPERLAAERAAGHAVFVDFTAEWCLNCKVNERLTLSKQEVKDAFEAHQVVLMKADWTNGDPAITAELNRFGRVGVPFYLLYTPDSADALVFPELLTPRIVLDALEKLPAR
jgi:thiol:disulfide interchange protein DsbD